VSEDGAGRPQPPISDSNRHSMLKSRVRLMSTPSRTVHSGSRFTPSSPVLEEDVLHPVQGHARTRSTTLDGRSGTSVLSSLHHSISPFSNTASASGSVPPTVVKQPPTFLIRQDDDEPLRPPERTLSPPPRPRSARVSREIVKLPVFLAPSPSPEPSSANASSNVSPQHSPGLIDDGSGRAGSRQLTLPAEGAQHEIEERRKDEGTNARHDSGVVVE
jgi:hypothetical protein